MDKKMRKTTNLCVEIMNSKTTSKLETWSGGTTSRFPFDVNVKRIYMVKNWPG